MARDVVRESYIELGIRRRSLPVPILLDTEKKFFDLVEEGDVDKVKSFLEANRELNVNCENFKGSTALHLAVKVENLGIVNLLIQRPDIELKDSVLHAIATGNQDIAERILDALGESPDATEYSTYDNSYAYSADITPLILAAQRGDYDMIAMLMKRGHKIARPHMANCLCTKCKEQIIEEMHNVSRIRLNCNKALANPAYISQATIDPMLYTFQIDAELKDCASIDKEFRADYAELREELSKYLFDLVSCCRNVEEIEVMLKHKTGYEGNQDVMFPRLQLAIDYNQKEFVSHSMIQQVLNGMWLDGYKSWNRFHLIEMTLRVLLRILVLPFLAMAIIIAPFSKFCKKYQAPVNKYISSLASYLIFLLLVCLLSYLDRSRNERGSPHTGLELPVVIFVLGFMWNTFTQVWVEGCKRFIMVPWHCYDVIMESVFFVTFFYWGISMKEAKSFKSEDTTVQYKKYWPSGDSTLIHEGLFAVGVLMAFGRLAFYCLQSSRLGPFQVSVGKMAVQILHFLVFCVVLITSFGWPITRLYVYYDGMSQTDKDGNTKSQLNSFTSFTNSFDSFFWAIFGMTPKESYDVVIENVGGTKSDPKINHHYFTETIGMCFFGLYEVIMSVALLNTLIAILSNTFEKVQSNVDKEWKFARTKMWIAFFHEEGAVPSPFNLIPNVSSCKSCFNYCMVLVKQRPGKAKFSWKKLFHIEEEEESVDEQQNFETLMTYLVQRYFQTKSEAEKKDN